jgi:Leucine-rich repeat (LRR) protein
MITQSDKQLKYLVSNKDTNSLQVLLFDDNINAALDTITGQNSVPLEYASCPLDFMLLSVTTTSRGIAWLKLPSTDATLVTDSTVVYIQSMLGLRALECVKCRQLTELDVSGLTNLQFLDLHGCNKLTKVAVNGLVELQYMNLDKCTDLTTVQGFDELTALKYLDLSRTQTASALRGLSELTELQHLTMNYCGSFDSLPQLST